jgi:uncharacterized protein YcgI (DUF1989 family)
VLRIIDPEGEQVADVAAFAAGDTRERFSSGRTIDYAETALVTTGHALYSTRSRAMMTIVEDTAGRHDLLLAPCSAELFRILHSVQGYHPNCLDNLAEALAEYAIPKDAIADTFNAFMNVEIGKDGHVQVNAPVSRAGDFVALRAEFDLFIGVAACSSEATNNGSLKPVVVEVSEANTD